MAARPDDAPPADLEERSLAWQVTGDPARLWPDVDPRGLPPAAGAIERSVRAILDGRSSSLGAADGRDASALGIAALVTGTGPLLGYWIEQGQLDVHGELARLLAGHLDHGRRRFERVRREVAPALSALVGAGATPIVIKGFHTAQAYFPEPGVRPLADVDVLVRPEEVERAEAALARAGFAGDPPLHRPYKRQWFPPGIDRRTWSLEFWHVQSPWWLELHDGPSFGHLLLHRVALEHPADHAVPWDTGLPLRVPDPAHLIAILATHLSGELFGMRLLRLVELVLVIRGERERGGLDWAEVEMVLDRTGALRFAYPALALTEQLAPGTIEAGIVARARAASTRIGRAVVDQLTPATPLLQERVSLAERLMWASGPVQIVRRLAQMVMPPADTPLPQLLRVYQGRLRRALAARLSWRVTPPPSGRSRGGGNG
jgi:hypothetical protein